ncbi:hypothetical protein MIMGU_mgv1a006705mg [Erythranthe guttata]|uniref:F-box domain-containing protein n=1 Tax=Erythranthe guttata TaxID=4155 RepID=A0A022Q1I2_ERYGU|nr:hypothetical protein MIMGU_mgv1a006705mg [Erythranthe guttata]
MDRISELPRDILQQILNFLSQKEAVRISVLSKSWRYNWCIRTNLDLSYNNFRGNKLQFLSVVDNILRRQHDERLSLSEFHLSISQVYPDHTSVFYLKKWVPLLTVIGVKKFRLSVYMSHTHHAYRKPPLKLPPVVFGAESLQDLHLENFEFDRKTIERILPWKHLRSLCLQKVYIEDEILQKIILGSPLLETLNVQGDCRRVGTVNLNHLHNLKYLSLQLCEREVDQYCSFEIHPPSLETIELRYSNISYHTGDDFRNLHSLFISNVRPSSLDRLSSTIFPSTSSKWKSEIYLVYQGSSWLLKLNELLNSLSHSEISLAVDQYCRINGNVMVRENVHNRPIVESLRMGSDLVIVMFFICRPRNIYGYKIKSARLWKFLMERESGNEDELFRGLEEVSIETRVDIREGWRPSTSLDFKLPGLEFRLALKWRNTPL